MSPTSPADLLPFATEASATRALRAAFDPHFACFPEVSLDLGGGHSGHKIDLVAQHRETAWTIGFEIKRGYRDMSEYAAALKQAADYRDALILEKAVPNAAGKKLAMVFCFRVGWRAASSVSVNGGSRSPKACSC